MSTETPDPASAGSTSVADLLAGAASAAIREGVGEVSRAQGQRGTVFLIIELNLGDGGVPLWVDSTVYFRRKRHHKDAAPGVER